jgi:hypothetical protein
MILLALAVAVAAPTVDDAHLLTELIGSAAQRPDVDVLTGEDVRRAVDLEAERQSLGCAASGCLAEIAQALGARFVVYGSLAGLGDDELILTLNIFDSAKAASGGRTARRGADLKALVDQIDPAVKALVAQAMGRAPPSSTRAKLLVLDVELRNGAAPPPPADQTSWLLIGGLSAAAAGVVGLVVGGGFDAAAMAADGEARKATLPQSDAQDRFAERDGDAALATVGYAVGGVLVVAGAALAAVGVME